MTERKQWAWTLMICAMAASCAMFRGPTVEDGKVCEEVDLGDGKKVKICAQTSVQIERVKALSASRCRLPQ